VENKTPLRLNTNQGLSTILIVCHYYTTSNAIISVTILKIMSDTSTLFTLASLLAPFTLST
jgi:hypothetical protein